ncbi:MAG TPA: heme exporter protein CcmD [Burkholderiaceae bacterium]|nr:heme exporter protein CcmD [Burkholderiaceae bacterium]
MHWGSLSDFLEMGGYAGYVWGAYVVTAVVIVVEIAALRVRRRRSVLDVARRARSGSAEN